MERSERLGWHEITRIDHDAAWTFIRRNERRELTVMLAMALRHVPASALQQIFGDYAHPHDVGRVGPAPDRPLLEVVAEFVADALRGKYYMEFDVSSKNCMGWSQGTQDFDATLGFVLECCIKESVSESPGSVVDAFEQLFALLRAIDEFDKPILFWADEGGVWELSIAWGKVVEGYARALSNVASPDEAHVRASKIIKDFGGADRERLTSIVRNVLGGDASPSFAGTTEAKP